MITTIVIPRGLPASGKSTWVREELPELFGSDRGVVLSYDNYRKQEPFASMDDIHERERAVKQQLLKDMATAIIMEAPTYVALDNTNLSDKSLNVIRHAIEDIRIAAGEGHTIDVYVEDKFLDVSTEECIRRDTYREVEKQVGPKVIFRMEKSARRLRQQRFLKIRKAYCATWQEDVGGKTTRGSIDNEGRISWQTEVVGNSPRCIIVDIDGTVALMHDRGPFEGGKVLNDLPNYPAISIVQDWIGARVNEYSFPPSELGPPPAPHIFFFTGRMNELVHGDDGLTDVKELTHKWVKEHVLQPRTRALMEYAGITYSLHIRANGDTRSDDVVKKDMYYEQLLVPNSYRVDFVLDDRNSVVNMWRYELGLPCLQAADGSF
ncbi:MAG: AAA family ATPase [Actinobacteria bacterium]|nr:AAA family ATPase [Actinomycetota bacterium]MCA1806554.1 AAA family ATPase [Actinomycetota bacterium]